jgi:hypothetical protein
MARANASVGSECAAQRTEGKNDDAKLKDASEADYFADGSHWQERDDDSELIGVDDPYRVRSGSVKVRCIRWKSNVGYRAVKDDSVSASQIVAAAQ